MSYLPWRWHECHRPTIPHWVRCCLVNHYLVNTARRGLVPLPPFRCTKFRCPRSGAPVPVPLPVGVCMIFFLSPVPVPGSGARNGAAVPVPGSGARFRSPVPVPGSVARFRCPPDSLPAGWFRCPAGFRCSGSDFCPYADFFGFKTLKS